MSEKKKGADTELKTEKKTSDAAVKSAKTDKAAKSATLGKGKAADKSKKKSNPVVKYFKDLKSEFKKVVWPSRKQVINNSTVVIVSMCVSGVFIWGVDTLFTKLLTLMLSLA